MVIIFLSYILNNVIGIKWEGSLTISILTLTFCFQLIQYSINNFEGRFYEMIRLHRQNVSEFEINENIKDKKVFVAIMKELRSAREIVLSVCYKNQNITQEIQHNSLSIAYLIIFFGIGTNSDRMLKKRLKNYITSESQITLLLESLDKNKKLSSKSKGHYKYTYFDGHQLRLGHYYRHLFQAFDYLDSSLFLNNTGKKKYAKMLRAQLSTYEQALFFINSITPLGLSWWRKGYIRKYKIVKNIPTDFFSDGEIDLKSYFKKSNSYFINNKHDHESTYFESDTYEMDDDYVFTNECVTKMKSTSTKNHND